MSGELGSVGRLKGELDTIGAPVLPSSWARRLVREKQPTERLIWVGRPGPRPRQPVGDGLVIIVSAILYLTIRVAEGVFEFVPDSWPAWTFPTALAVVMIVLGIAIVFDERRRRNNLLYVLTDRRAIIFSFGLQTSIRTFQADDLRRSTRIEREEGTGDIILERFSIADSDGNTKYGENGLYDLPDVGAVFKLIQNMASHKGVTK